MKTDELLRQVLQAHGGLERWQQVRSIQARLSSGGFAFAFKFQPHALRGLQISVEPHTPRVVLANFMRPGWRGIWTPDRVQLLDEQGCQRDARERPRAQFSRWSRQLRWDKLDILYFAGYALWNYLSFPFLLVHPGVSVKAEESTQESGARCLRAHFDATVATHSAVQKFHIDSECNLLRHDYTADVIGGWARVANLCQASTQVQGFRFYTRRKVFPIMGTSILPLPTLVWIELDDLTVSMNDQPTTANLVTPN